MRSCRGIQRYVRNRFGARWCESMLSLGLDICERCFSFCLQDHFGASDVKSWQRDDDKITRRLKWYSTSGGTGSLETSQLSGVFTCTECEIILGAKRSSEVHTSPYASYRTVSRSKVLLEGFHGKEIKIKISKNMRKLALSYANNGLTNWKCNSLVSMKFPSVIPY